MEETKIGQQQKKKKPTASEEDREVSRRKKKCGGRGGETTRSALFIRQKDVGAKRATTNDKRTPK